MKILIEKKTLYLRMHCMNIVTLNDLLKRYALEGWKLHTVFTSKLGKLK
ncbi:hypothetical protein lbkm_1258 [Lachnospiraceae bacterium KM106-2]|nr:hypothetical protein lbkm_1258 [Lachnospiraceae bacterium KM106-2]